MSSSRAAVTARPSRDSSENNEYKVILPTIPPGSVSFNTLLLHGDPVGRPYKADHFGDALKDSVNKDDVAGFGPYQYNHVWAISFHSRLEKEKLLARKEILVKDRKCIVFDPNKKEVDIKISWVPIHVPDDEVRRAFQPVGTVKKVERIKWKNTFFEGIETTTRVAQVELKTGITADDVPHIMNIAGCQVLLAIAGRPPLCLKCKKVGHIRKQCQTPWCKICRAFGHAQEECVSSYASKLRREKEDTTYLELDAGGDEEMNEQQQDTSNAGKDVTVTPSDMEADETTDKSPRAQSVHALTKGSEAVTDEENAYNRTGDTQVQTQHPDTTENDDNGEWTASRHKRRKPENHPGLSPQLVEVGQSALDNMDFLNS